MYITDGLQFCFTRQIVCGYDVGFTPENVPDAT